MPVLFISLWDKNRTFTKYPKTIYELYDEQQIVYAINIKI